MKWQEVLELPLGTKFREKYWVEDQYVYLKLINNKLEIHNNKNELWFPIRAIDDNDWELFEEVKVEQEKNCSYEILKLMYDKVLEENNKLKCEQINQCLHCNFYFPFQYTCMFCNKTTIPSIKIKEN